MRAGKIVMLAHLRRDVLKKARNESDIVRRLGGNEGGSGASEVMQVTLIRKSYCGRIPLCRRCAPEADMAVQHIQTGRGPSREACYSAEVSS